MLHTRVHTPSKFPSADWIVLVCVCVCVFCHIHCEVLGYVGIFTIIRLTHQTSPHVLYSAINLHFGTESQERFVGNVTI